MTGKTDAVAVVTVRHATPDQVAEALDQAGMDVEEVAVEPVNLPDRRIVGLLENQADMTGYYVRKRKRREDAEREAAACLDRFEDLDDAEMTRRVKQGVAWLTAWAQPADAVVSHHGISWGNDTVKITATDRKQRDERGTPVGPRRPCIIVRPAARKARFSKAHVERILGWIRSAAEEYGRDVLAATRHNEDEDGTAKLVNAILDGTLGAGANTVFTNYLDGCHEHDTVFCGPDDDCDWKDRFDLTKKPDDWT